MTTPTDTEIAAELEKDVHILDSILTEHGHGPHTLARVGTVRKSLSDLITDIDTPVPPPSPAPGPEPTPSPHPAPQPQPSPTPTPPTGFHGIVEFTGTSGLHNPAIIGGIVLPHWSQIEPSEGQYDWSTLMDTAQQWISAGKKFAVRINTAVPKNGNDATPPWLLSASGQRVVVSPAGSHMPVYWDTPFTTARRRLCDSLIQQLLPLKDHLLWVQIPLEVWGESKPDATGDWPSPDAMLQAWEQQAGYTDDVQFSWIKDIVAHDSLAIWSVLGCPMTVACDSTFIGGSRSTVDLINWLRQVNVWPQNDGYRIGRDISHFTSGGPNVQEPFASSSSGVADMNPFGDLLKGMATGTYALVFGSDITPANQPALDSVASSVQRG